MIIRNHILTLFSSILVLTGTSLSPTITATTDEKITISKTVPSEEFRKFEPQDALLSRYLLTSDFTLTWQTLMTEIRKKELQTQIKAVKEISNLHIDEVKNLKELHNIEVKLKALHEKMITEPDESKWFRCLIEEIGRNGKDMIYQPSFNSSTINKLFTEIGLNAVFRSIWNTLMTEISKKTIQTQIEAVREIGNLHILDQYLSDEYLKYPQNKNILLSDIVQKLKALHEKISKKDLSKWGKWSNDIKSIISRVTLYNSWTCIKRLSSYDWSGLYN